MPPTSALTPTSSENWARFSRSPSRTGRGVVAVVLIARRRAADRSMPPRCRGRRRAPTRRDGPRAVRMLAPVIARSPCPHITVTGPSRSGVWASEPSSTLIAPGTWPASNSSRWRTSSTVPTISVWLDEWDPDDRAARRSPGVDAAVELADDVLVADVEALADDLVTVLAVAGDDHDRPIERRRASRASWRTPVAARSTSNRARDRLANSAIGRTSTTSAPASTWRSTVSTSSRSSRGSCA